MTYVSFPLETVPSDDVPRWVLHAIAGGFE